MSNFLAAIIGMFLILCGAYLLSSIKPPSDPRGEIMYFYFASYSFEKDGRAGFGSLDFYSNHKITSRGDIVDLEEKLKKSTGNQYVIILSYQFLRKDYLNVELPTKKGE